MTDKKLLELAANAAGIDGCFTLGSGNAMELNKPHGFRIYWNPLANDEDAFRLMVKLGIVPRCINGVAFAFRDGVCDEQEPYTSDPYEATRRAIVRAAAEIGKQMEK